MPDTTTFFQAALGVALLMTLVYFLSLVIAHIAIILLIGAACAGGILFIRRRNLRSF